VRTPHPAKLNPDPRLAYISVFSILLVLSKFFFRFSKFFGLFFGDFGF